MGCLGTLIWWIFGGLVSALGWFFTGTIWCITIVGIPVGLQCFKIGTLTLMPFGSEVISTGGAGSFLLNILWFFFGGFMLCLGHLFWGVVLTLSVVGIPFGKQHFKLAGLSLSPFGKSVV